MLNKKNLLTLVFLVIPVVLIIGAAVVTNDRLLERIVTNFCISLVLVLGLQVFMGNSGILSFAHIGFMGVGAYASGILSMPLQMKGMALPDLYPMFQSVQITPYLAILIGALVAAAVAAVVSYPLMRLSDAAAVITSFALLVVLHTIMLGWSAMTNGPRTFFGVPKATDIYLAGGVAIAAIALALAFKESRVGLLLRAVRDDADAAEATGAHLSMLRWRAFIVSALLAGLGGALWGHFITSFSPKAFYLKETFVILGMLVIGGPMTVSGAVFGAIAVTLVFEGVRATESAINIAQLFSTPVVGLTEVTLACAMILLLIFRPGGIFSTRELGALFIARRRRKSLTKEQNP